MIDTPVAWKFTGKVVDFAGDAHFCAYCGDRHLRFGYQVSTGQKPHYAYLGFDCLLKHGFRLGEYDYQTLSEKKSSLQTDATRRATLRELIRLNASLESSGDLSFRRLIKSFKHYGRFSPRQAVFLVKVVKSKNYHFPLALINITTKENQHREQLAAMSEKDASVIRPLLTVSQMRWITTDA